MIVGILLLIGITAVFTWQVAKSESKYGTWRPPYRIRARRRRMRW